MLAAGWAVVSADESVEPEEPADPSIVVLEPGENLVGWVGDSRSVALLKRQVAGIESVKGWDAQAQQYVDAESLEPGKGYVITLGGGESVSFRRPVTPVLGKIELKRGRNLVTWLGPDDWSIDRVVLGVGRSLVRVDWNGMTYRSSQGENTGSLPLVQRADALWVEVSRTINWLQPAGVMPTIKFAGEAAEALKSAVRRDSVDVMNHFAEEFGVQPDGSILTVYVAADVNARIDALGADGIGTDGVHRSWYTAGGWASPLGHIVLKLEQWDPEFAVNTVGQGDYGQGRYVLAHEYYHAIQQQTSSTNAAQWLVEGGADWAEAGVRRLDAGTSLNQELAGNRNSAGSQDAPPLDHTERIVGTWHYTLGALASHQLELRSGKQSLIEFWRALLPEPLGPLGRWKSNPPWQSVFQDVFGFTVDSFYEEFAMWREGLATVALRGRVVGPDGRGLPYVAVTGYTESLGDTPWYWDSTHTLTDADGFFELAVSVDAVVGVDLGGCDVYHSPQGLTFELGLATKVSLLAASEKEVLIALTDDICVWQIQGMLVDDKGQGVSGQWIYAGSERGVGTQVQSESGGAFAITIPVSGNYTLSTSIDGCRIYYRRGEAPGTRQQATQFSIQSGDVTGVRFQLTEGLCSTKIAGRLLDGDGTVISDVRVYARHDDNSSAWATTDSDGSFSITVPSAGVYRLDVSIDSCRVYFRRGGAVTSREDATRITIDERDVTGVRFQLRRGQCSTKVMGVLLHANGDAIAGADVWAQNDDGSSWARTDSDGSFQITVPEAGQYRIQARIDGCTIYYRRGGAPGSHQQATQIRVSDSDVTGITLQLAQGMCEHRISGRLLNADGSARSGQWINASSNAGSAGASTSSDGSFSFAVPASGSYRLQAHVDGCWIYRGSRGPVKTWNSASQLRVSNADVTGIEFRLPEDPSSFCN